ncbi:hypothetical protein Pfo_027279 [Paulownia fortunei]|nr:hypothetical protein Pfo_027279 [Paulownia fortunei]
MMNRRLATQFEAKAVVTAGALAEENTTPFRLTLAAYTISTQLFAARTSISQPRPAAAPRPSSLVFGNESPEVQTQNLGKHPAQLDVSTQLYPHPSRRFRATTPNATWFVSNSVLETSDGDLCSELLQGIGLSTDCRILLGIDYRQQLSMLASYQAKKSSTHLEGYKDGYQKGQKEWVISVAGQEYISQYWEDQKAQFLKSEESLDHLTDGALQYLEHGFNNYRKHPPGAPTGIVPLLSTPQVDEGVVMDVVLDLEQGNGNPRMGEGQ